MFATKLLLAFLFSFVLSKAEICEPRPATDLKTYVIDLDKAPRDRFREVINDFKESIFEWIQAEKNLIDPNLLPLVLPLIEEVAAKIDDYIPHPFNEEIKGIAEGLEIPVGDVVLVNLIYDLTTFCTGILALDSKGQILHGRNLDYGLAPYLQNMTFIAKFQRNNELVFTSAHLAGYLGVLTGHKYKQFTFQINERDQGDWWVNALYLILDKKATPLSFLTRNLMENITNYDDAVNLMSKSDLIAPAYFIIGGITSDQAVVLTRNQSSLVDAWKIDPKSPRFDSWFLIETNYDHWTQPPPNDDRRDPGIKYMQNKTEKNIGYEALLDVMITQPVCNKETVYSVVMSAMDDSETGFLIYNY